MPLIIYNTLLKKSNNSTYGIYYTKNNDNDNSKDYGNDDDIDKISNENNTNNTIVPLNETDWQMLKACIILNILYFIFVFYIILNIQSKRFISKY